MTYAPSDCQLSDTFTPVYIHVRPAGYLSLDYATDHFGFRIAVTA